MKCARAREVLGIAADARLDRAIVNEHFRGRARDTHPDRPDGDAAAFSECREAKGVLDARLDGNALHMTTPADLERLFKKPLARRVRVHVPMRALVCGERFVARSQPFKRRASCAACHGYGLELSALPDGARDSDPSDGAGPRMIECGRCEGTGRSGSLFGGACRSCNGTTHVPDAEFACRVCKASRVATVAGATVDVDVGPARSWRVPVVVPFAGDCSLECPQQACCDGDVTATLDVQFATSGTPPPIVVARDASVVTADGSHVCVFIRELGDERALADVPYTCHGAGGAGGPARPGSVWRFEGRGLSFHNTREDCVERGDLFFVLTHGSAPLERLLHTLSSDTLFATLAACSGSDDGSGKCTNRDGAAAKLVERPLKRDYEEPPTNALLVDSSVSAAPGMNKRVRV